MKYFSLLLLLLFSITGAIAQENYNIYRDALKLADGKTDLETLMAEYPALGSQPQFKYLSAFQVNGDFIRLADPQPSTRTQKTAASPPNIAPLVQGLSDFLVSRAKKELSIAFFEGFRNSISNEKFKDYQILLPGTYSEFQLIDDKIYDFQPYILTLRKKILEDLKILPQNLNQVLNNKDTQLGKWAADNADKADPLKLLVLLGSNLNNQNNLGESIEILAKTNITHNISLDNTISFISILSQSFKKEDPDTANYYISKEDIDELFTDDKRLKAFIGLTVAKLYEKNQDLALKIDNTFDKYQKIKNIYSLFGNALGSRNQLVGINSDSLKNEKVFTSYLRFLSVLNDLHKEIFKSTNDYLDKIIYTSEMVKSLFQGEYSRGIMLLNRVVSSFTYKHKSGKVIYFINKYGLFMAQLADAKDAAKVQETLEYFAEPLGSWREKSKQRLLLSVDSFVGVGVDGLKNGFISTPVGLSASGRLFKGKLSWNGLISIIDIGAFTSFAGPKDSVATIYWKQIYSPGIFAGIQPWYKLPLFINIGVQRKSVLQSEGILEPSWRGILSLNVNIPVTYLYRK